MDTPPESDVSAAFPFTQHTAKVLGLNMKYIDTNPDATEGPTALFMHGNGSTSYLWRNIIPHVSPFMRCVAADMIGMGDSDKPKNLSYRFTDHYTFISTFINTVIPAGPILFVIHDWGSALGLHWMHMESERAGSLQPPRVLGIAMMEFVRPFPTWEELGMEGPAEQFFRAFRTPGVGRKLIVDENKFVEFGIHGGQLRKLSDEEIEEHKRPYVDPPTREPLYVWTNEIPIEYKPSDVHDICTRYHNWLLETDVPKLMFWATPGAIVPPAKAKWYMERLKNTEGVDLGQGLHYVQEDHPRAIGTGIAKWVQEKLGIKGT